MKPNKKMLTPLGIAQMNPPKSGQTLHWDKLQPGLALFVSYGGTKTFRSTFIVHGKYQTRLLGRVGDITLTEARAMTKADRELAEMGIDPRQPKEPTPTEPKLYGEVVDEFIAIYAKVRQRTWVQTERVLKVNTAAWLNRTMSSITKHEATALLEKFNAEGHPYKASTTQCWLKTIFKWAYNRDLIPTDMMQKVTVEVDERVRERVYSDDEIKATWRAADQLDPDKGAYVKLLI
jgi:hypothetical protein